MRIAAFYSDSPFAGWVQAQGFAEILKRMGHEVVAIAVPPISKVTKEMAANVNKPIDDCELVIVSGPEHLRPWIKAFYPDWGKLKVPKVAWYHESFVREDYKLNYKNFESMYDFHFFPDKNDAMRFHGEWLPLGVDTEMFNSQEPHNRTIPVAFIGLMYPKRARFVEELKPHLGDINIQYRFACQSDYGLMPAIGVWDFDGFNMRRSMELLADTYRCIKVFVTFPSLSNVLVAKVLESLACGCTLVAPKQVVEMDGLYWPYEGAYQCAEAIRNAVTHNIDGRRFVHEHHRMELCFLQIFEKVGLCVHS